MKQVFALLNFLIILYCFTHIVGEKPRFTYGSYKRVYRPIRITPYYRRINYELGKDDVEILKDTLVNAILYIKRVLSVVPVQDPLLLARDACKSSWLHGRNAGKCANIKKDYGGEFCLDGFKIPDEHLDGFYTWSNRPRPEKTWYMEGNGIRNTDFVLYVQSLTTHSCLSNHDGGGKESLIAYARYCKLDNNDRPTAGYINFCPSEFHTYKNDRRKLTLTIIHELFHCLGFSNELFEKYRDCSMSVDNCPPWGFPVVRQTLGRVRLVTPSVVQAMQNHFGCDKGDFGGPLYVKNGKAQSHWDDSVLTGSVMAPNIAKPDFTFVDPITLSAFQDMGWYVVNFSSADNYQIGRDSGCDRTTTEMCLNQGANSWCNNLHTHTLYCEQSGSGYKTVTEACKTSTSKSVHPVQERCLFVNISMSSVHSNHMYNARCFSVRCSRGELQISLNGHSWMDCLPGETVDIINTSEMIVCPDFPEIVCNSSQTPLYLQDLSQFETTTLRHYVTRANLVTAGPYGRGYTNTYSNTKYYSGSSALVKCRIIVELVLFIYSIMISIVVET